MATQYLWTKVTDKHHKIVLKSEFIYAMWHWGKARGGSQINIEVRTSFVGDGAKMELTFKGEKSKKFGSLKEKIFSNRYRTIVELPENFEIGEDIWFEVKFPKHGIKGESNRIPAYPKPIMHSLSWNQEIAHRGDVLKLTGEFSKIEPYAECVVTIYGSDCYFLRDLDQQDLDLPINNSTKLIIMKICQMPRVLYSKLHEKFPKAVIVYVCRRFREKRCKWCHLWGSIISL